MSLIKKIKDYYKSTGNILFTTPSHSQGNFIIPEAEHILGNKYFKSDFSEIEGFDNLRFPEGAIKALHNKISDILFIIQILCLQIMCQLKYIFSSKISFTGYFINQFIFIFHCITTLLYV